MGEYYGLTVNALCKLMQYRGQEGLIEIIKLGGVEEICEHLGTSPTQGLVGNTLEHRRVTFGSNDIPRERTATLSELLWNVFRDRTLIILVVLAGLALFYYSEILVFAFIKIGCVVIVIAVTVIVNYCAERRFQCLLDDVTKKRRECTVIRNAVAKKIFADEIVVGDVCIVNDCDVIPADGILIESNALKIDESSFIGHSSYANKSVQLDPMVFGGTILIDGSGTMLALAVGINTHRGMISSLLMQHRNNVTGSNDCSPILSFRSGTSILQQKVQRLFFMIIRVCLIISATIFVVLAAQFAVHFFIIEQRSWTMSVIARFVSFLILAFYELLLGLPEGIPLTVTIVLAVTMKKLIGDKKLVRNIHSSETLGNATAICFDKTGTLTTNRMEIVQCYICERQQTCGVENKLQTELGDKVLNLIAENISVNSSSSSTVTYTSDNNIVEQIGNKTECALLGFVTKIGLSFQTIRETNTSPIVHDFPFNSDRKLMATVIQISDGYRLFVKGASEVVLLKCAFIIGQNEKLKEMSKDIRERITDDVIKPITSQRLRTISLAYRDFVHNRTAVNEAIMNDGVPDWTDEQNVVKKLTCLGIFAIDDPIRCEVPALVKKLQSFGITLRMVTGDNIDTAASVAAKCGIIDSSSDVALDATEFNRRIRDTDGNIKQQLFDEVYPTLRVLARASPMDKYNLVNGMIESTKKRRREVVAMVGDGDNDALALKRADVAITLSQLSTDLVKNASTILLTDNQLGGIINTVVWGRHAYDSIAKFVQFVLLVKLVTVAIGAFFTLLSYSHFGIYRADLFFNILALVPIYLNDPIEDVMIKKPNGRNERIISKNMIINVFGKSFYQIVVLSTFHFVIANFIGSQDHKREQLILNSFVVMSLFDVFNARSLRGERNIFRKIQQNFVLCLTWTIVFIAHVFATQCVFVHPITPDKPMNLTQWAFCLFIGVGILIWQQLLFTCNSKRRVNKNTSEVFV